MVKYFITLLAAAAFAISCKSQNIVPRTNDSFTTQDSRWAALYNMFAPRYADTTAANAEIGIDSCGAIIFTYDAMNLWYRACSPKRWVLLLPTASEGLQLNGRNIEFGGLRSNPALLGTTRNILANRNMIIFGQTIPGAAFWQHSDSAFSPFQFLSTDTLIVNSITSPTPNMPLSGIFARRTMYYADGIYKTQKIYGHYLAQYFNWQDSMVFYTEGGDYNQGVTIEQRLKPRGTGKQVARAAHGTGTDLLPYYGQATLLSNTVLENSASNYIYTRGWLVGIQSYLVAGFNGADTVERFSFYQTNNFLSSGSRVKKYFGIDFQHNLATSSVDSSWGIWDMYGYRHWLRGSTVIGNAYDSSVTGYSLKVNGTMYMRGLFQGFQGTDVASTAGVMTLPGSGTAGNVYEITGTNTITAINNTNLKNGYEVTLLFTSTATLTDGTANSGTSIGMELAGNTNFTASAGDAVTLVLSEIGGTQRFREKCRSDN